MNQLFSATVAQNSITNPQSTTYDDSQSPYTLLEWITNTSNIPTNPDRYIADYNAYIKKWRVATNQNREKTQLSIKDTYVRFLKDISINYTTSEERRYLQTIDFYSLNEADAAIPFFAKKIRETIQNIHRERQLAKFQKIKYGLRGSKTGLEKTIFDTIVNHVMIRDKSKVDHVSRHTRVDVQESYDISQTYFDTQFLFATPGMFLTSSGEPYTGYYGVEHHLDGRRLYVAGKCSPDQARDYLIPTETGYIHECHHINIISVVQLGNSQVQIHVEKSACDHWSYRIEQGDVVDVRRADQVTITVHTQGQRLYVYCMDQHNNILASASKQLYLVE